MVAKTAELPNLRKMFIPDDGYVFIEADLERADAQVVAWDANDEPLKEAFRSGEDIHTLNAMDIFHCSREAVHVGGSNSPRQKAKIGVHATNYWCQPRTLSQHLGIVVREAEDFQKRWFAAHPAIHDWHERIWNQLQVERTVYNKFGFRIYYRERMEKKLLAEALAWIGSSTTSVVINKGLVNVYANVPAAELLLQNHDSLVLQARKEAVPAIYDDLLREMDIEVPYEDPLHIPVTIAASHKSWGEVIELDKARKILRDRRRITNPTEYAEKTGTPLSYVEDVIDNEIWQRIKAA